MQKALTRFLEILGYREVVLKSDGERSLVKMKMEAAKQARGVSRAVPEESPQGDARANGQAEAAVKEVKWRIRAILLTLAKKFEGGVPQGHPLTYWAPRYAAEQINRFKIGEDGRTPDERRTGKKWVKPMPLFGEKILVKPAGKARRGEGRRRDERSPLGRKEVRRAQQEQLPAPPVVIIGASPGPGGEVRAARAEEALEQSPDRGRRGGPSPRHARKR